MAPVIVTCAPVGAVPVGGLTVIVAPEVGATAVKRAEAATRCVSGL